MTPRRAWAACGMPQGEKGIQNIRKRGMEKRRSKAAKEICFDVAVDTQKKALSSSSAKKNELSVEELIGKGKPRVGYRLKSSQLDKARLKKLADRQKFDDAYIAATNEWHGLVTSGRSGGKLDGTTATAVAMRYASTLPVGSPKLTARSLYNAYRDGRCGIACPRKGFSPAIPSEMVQSVADYASLKQVAGDEQPPRKLDQVAMATVKGTRFEQALSNPGQCQYFLKRVREKMGEISFISTACREAVDDRRWQYLTNTNLSTWFEGYVSALVTHRFLPEGARYKDLSKEQLDICAFILHPMLNGDESHQKLSNEGEKAGGLEPMYM